MPGCRAVAAAPKSFKDDCYFQALQVSFVSCFGRLVREQLLQRASKTIFASQRLQVNLVSCFARLVREQLCELELPHIYHTVARNSPKRKELENKWQTFQVYPS